MKKYFILFLVLIFTLTSGALVGCGQPPYFKTSGERVHLVNNSKASDHTWQEVVAFLEWDATDKKDYTFAHTCGFFAEELHNRAEYCGFRTAFVIVEFETGELHALNAFNIADYGLVYIDCTGKGRFEVPAPADTSIELASVSSRDKVAYIVEGEKMSFISLGYTEQNFSYEWYKKCRARLEAYINDLARYKKDLALYEENVRELQRWYHEWCENEGENEGENEDRDALFWEQFIRLRQYHDWLRGDDPFPEQGQRLQLERKRLGTEWAEVRGYNWQESESPVKSIKVYW